MAIRSAARAQIDELVERYLSGADRDQLDPILDACVSVYREQLDEDGQVDFKGKAKAFLRAYGFLATILPYTVRRVGEALHLLDLPCSQTARARRGRPVEGYSRSYRHGQLPGGEAGGAGHPASRRECRNRAGPNRRRRTQKPEPEMDRLSNIITDFNDRFGNIDWKDQDKIEKVIAEELPAKVAGR